MEDFLESEPPRRSSSRSRASSSSGSSEGLLMQTFEFFVGLAVLILIVWLGWKGYKWLASSQETGCASVASVSEVEQGGASSAVEGGSVGREAVMEAGEPSMKASEDGVLTSVAKRGTAKAKQVSVAFARSQWEKVKGCVSRVKNDAMQKVRDWISRLF